MRHMPSSTEYREKAMACIAQAKAMKVPRLRAAMLSIAKGYRDMADCVGRRHQGVADIVWLIVKAKREQTWRSDDGRAAKC
jgi:hypothetical protein